jgi:hypothetical protein
MLRAVVARSGRKSAMSDIFQALLDSGALYLAVGAVICIALGIGAVRRLFREANKIEAPRSQKD